MLAARLQIILRKTAIFAYTLRVRAAKRQGVQSLHTALGHSTPKSRLALLTFAVTKTNSDPTAPLDIAYLTLHIAPSEINKK